MIEVISNEEARDLLSVKRQDPEPVKNEVTSFDTYIPVNALPSGFKGYPEGTKISYKPITLGELEALNSGEPDIERGIAMLLKSIHCNTLNAEELYYWDVMYIGIQRKLLAFGDTRGTLYTQCENCGEIIQRDFEFTELEFKECEAPDLPILTNICGVDVEISLLTIKDFLELDLNKGELDVYARMIKNLDYNTAFELISNATGKEAKKIRFIDRQLNYGLKPLKAKCNGIIQTVDEATNKQKQVKCNQTVKVEVRSPFEVVFPEDILDGCDEFEIQYGRK